VSKRRSISLFTAMLACMALAVAACGGGDEAATSSAPAAKGPVKDPTSPVTVTFAGHVGQEPQFKKFAKDFNTLHPNISIEFETIPFEQVEQKLTTQIAAGNAPDAAYVDASLVGDFGPRGAIISLEDYIARAEFVEKSDYVDAFLDSALVDGAMYGLPFDGESTGLFYRTDLFQEAGIDTPPTTWAEFEEDAKALTDPENKQYGTAVFSTEAAYYWYPWLYQAGGGLLGGSDGTDILFDDEPAKKAAEFYVNLAQYSPRDFLNSNSYDGRVAFATGKVGMYIAGAWFAGVLDQEFPKIKGRWDTAPLPEDEQCGTTIAGDNLVIFEGSDQKDAAWLWLDYLSKKDNMAQWTYRAEGSTLLPPRKSLLESPELTQKKPVLAGFADAMKCGVTSNVTNEAWPRVEEILNDKLGRAMYGELSASEALDQAASEAQPLLDRAAN
jgi:multiple sugar transport system substrate-binding protein